MDFFKSIGGAVNSAANHVAKKAGEAIDDVKDTTGNMVDGVKKGVEQGKKQLEETAKDVWETGNDIHDRGRDFMEDTIQDGIKAGKRIHRGVESMAREGVEHGERAYDMINDQAEKFEKGVKIGARKVGRDIKEDVGNFKDGLEIGARRVGRNFERGVDRLEEGAQRATDTAERFEDGVKQGARQTIGDLRRGAERVRDGAERFEDGVKQGARQTIGELRRGAEMIEDGAERIKDDVKMGARQTMRDLQRGAEIMEAGAKRAKRGIEEGAVRFGEGVKAGATQVAGDVRAGLEIAGDAAVYVNDKVIEQSKEVMGVIEELKDTTVAEMMDIGWEAAGFSEAERDLLKQVVSAKVDRASEFVSDAANELIELNKEVTIGLLKGAALASMNPVENLIVDSLLHEGGFEGLINDKIDVLEMGAVELAELVSEHKELLDPAARLAGDLSDMMTEAQDSLVYDVMLGLMPEMRIVLDQSVTTLSSILEVASKIPEVSEAIVKDPQEFSAVMALIRPGHMARQIENLDVGESFKISIGGETKFKALDVGATGEIKVERLDKDTIRMTVKQMASGGQSLGDPKMGDADYAVSVGAEIVIDVPVDKAPQAITQLMQLNVHHIDKFDSSAFEGITLRSVSVPLEAEIAAKAKAELHKNLHVGADAKIKVGFTSATETEKDGSISDVRKAELQFSAGVGISTEPLNVAFPDGVKLGRPESALNDLLEMASPDEQKMLSDVLNTNDSSKGAKFSSSMIYEGRIKADGTLAGSATAKIQVGITPNELEAKVKLEIKDGVALAKALAQPASNLAEAISTGGIDLIALAKSRPDLVPDVIQLDVSLDATGYDDVGFALDAKAFKVNANQRHEVKKTLYKMGDPEVGTIDEKRIARDLDSIDEERQLLRTPPAPRKPLAGRLMDFAGLRVKG